MLFLSLDLFQLCGPIADMTLDSASYVAIVELVVFIPALIASIVGCARHGFGRSAGWIYTNLLNLVRIAGAICRLIVAVYIALGVTLHKLQNPQLRLESGADLDNRAGNLLERDSRGRY